MYTLMFLGYFRYTLMYTCFTCEVFNKNQINTICFVFFHDGHLRCYLTFLRAQTPTRERHGVTALSIAAEGHGCGVLLMEGKLKR